MSDENFKPSDAFHNAASFVSTSPQLRNVSNNVKLEVIVVTPFSDTSSMGSDLYALYKMVTVSRAPQGGKPSIFDMTGRAKWEAWSKESKQSELVKESLEDVQNRYLALCGKYGWVPNTTQETNAKVLNKQTNEEEDIHDIDWDAPDDPQSEKHRHDGRAMGNAVSVLEQEEEDELDSTTLHGLTVLGETGKLRTLLDLDHEVDINEKDEYGYTALHLAADRGHLMVVKLLLDHGADYMLLDADGFSAMELAEASGKEEIIQVLRQAESMQ